MLSISGFCLVSTVNMVFKICCKVSKFTKRTEKRNKILGKLANLTNLMWMTFKNIKKSRHNFWWRKPECRVVINSLKRPLCWLADYVWNFKLIFCLSLPIIKSKWHVEFSNYWIVNYVFLRLVSSISNVFGLYRNYH